MIDNKEFRKSAHEIVDWMADCFEKIEEYPVKSKVTPQEVYAKLPDSAPEQSELMKSCEWISNNSNQRY